ncbi:MAG: PQQ-like beta-propeller repeat protein, partial [Acidobacteria bacterium]|nr:PQQ-like beta-propeller repeat protein [Acidobacteriota bacterium]
APTPAVDGERLYVFFESGDLAAMSHDGEVLWQRSLTDEYGPFKGNHGVGASVALQAGAVVILVQHEGPSYLLSVDRESGQNYWKTDTRQRVSWSSPLVLESRERSEILLSSNGALESYDADSGEMLWSVEGLEGNTIPSPSAQGDLVIVASTAGEHSMAVRRGGHGEVTASHVAWRAVSAAASFASPLIHEGCAYFVNRAGVVRCLEPESGEEIWTFRLPGPCWASPLGAGDRVYFFTKDGETVVLRAGTSEPEVLASSKLPTEGPVYGIAAVDGAIVVRTGQQLLRLGASPTSVASR